MDPSSQEAVPLGPDRSLSRSRRFQRGTCEEPYTLRRTSERVRAAVVPMITPPSRSQCTLSTELLQAEKPDARRNSSSRHYVIQNATDSPALGGDPSTESKRLSRDTTMRSCCFAVAAIQMSSFRNGPTFFHKGSFRFGRSHTVRAQGSNMTPAPSERAGMDVWKRGSIRTVPVK